MSIKKLLLSIAKAALIIALVLAVNTLVFLAAVQLATLIGPVAFIFSGVLCLIAGLTWIFYTS